MIRIMLVEDQLLFRLGIEMTLSGQDGIEIISTVSTGQEAIESYLTVRPDVILMDIRMPVMSGIEASIKIRQIDRNVKIIFLTSMESMEDIFSAFSVGASGYCLKDIEPELLLRAIRTACADGLCIDPRIAQKMIHFIASSDAKTSSAASATLTARDEEVLTSLSNSAMLLGMTLNTKLSVITILNKIVIAKEFSNLAIPEMTIEADLGSKLTFLDPLGAGGMGKVFKALYKKTGALVAVKVIQFDDADARQRVIREARIMSSLSHPRIVRVFDFLLDGDKTAHIVMELVDGSTLCDVLECGGAMIEDEAVKIFLQCVEGLTYLHGSGVTHRDIKPSNIMLFCEDEESINVKISDFGIARDHSMNRLTMQGEVFGSPLYMSPEQCVGDDDVDPRSDIYSFGCVMFELLTGLPPFIGSTRFETMSMHVHSPPPSIEDCSKRKISAKLIKIVEKCLSKKPRDRYQTSKDLYKDLEQLQPVQVHL